jgi:hypothetical protein
MLTCIRLCIGSGYEYLLGTQEDCACLQALSPPNAPDQKRALAWALAMTFAPVFCILMLAGPTRIYTFVRRSKYEFNEFR